VRSVHKAIHIEGRGAAEHVIGGTAEASGEDAQGLALAVLGANAVEKLLARGILLKEEDGGLAVGPLEVGVADLGAGGSGDLSGRGLLALHEAGIGQEVPDAGEAGDVVKLIEEREREDAPDTGNGLEEFEGIRVIDLGLVADGALDGADDLIEVRGQDEIGLYAGPHHGVGD